MPGLSFIHESPLLHKGETPPPRTWLDADGILSILEGLRHDSRYVVQSIHSDSSCHLSSVRHAQYPLVVLDSQEYLICIEGCLYDSGDAKVGEIVTLARAIFGSQPAAAREQLRAWLARTDGDFIVFGMEKSTSRWFMFNDMLGRLPVYCTLADHRLALARDITFIARATNNSQMDRMALAQCLLFGYPLGNRTLLQNVFRLAPATLILIAESGIQIERLHDHDFDLCSHADRDLDSNASVLADLFVKACAARSRSMADSQQILSLSGGLDYRAAGAWAHDHADLRDHARGHHILQKHVGITGERIHAFLDARATRIIETDDRGANLHRLFHHF